MNKRAFVKGAAAIVTATYVWIPRISLAKISGDPRDAVVKSQNIIAKIWELESQKSTQVAEGRGAYSSSVKETWSKMEQHDYVEKDRFFQSLSGNRGLAMNGSYRPHRQNYCHSYMHRERQDPVAYLSTIPFIVKSFVLERAIQHISISRTIDYLYPDEYIEVFNALIDQSFVTKIIAREAIWIAAYDVTLSHKTAGKGMFKIVKRGDPSQTIFELSFEYDFS